MMIRVVAMTMMNGWNVKKSTIGTVLGNGAKSIRVPLVKMSLRTWRIMFERERNTVEMQCEKLMDTLLERKGASNGKSKRKQGGESERKENLEAALVVHHHPREVDQAVVEAVEVGNSNSSSRIILASWSSFLVT